MKYTLRVQQMIESFDVPVEYVPDYWEGEPMNCGGHKTDDFLGEAKITHSDFSKESTALIILAHEYGHHIIWCDVGDQEYADFIHSKTYCLEKLAWREGFKFAKTHGLLTLDDIRENLSFIRWCLNTYRPTLQGGF